MLDINKQRMQYSKQIGKVPVYVTDADGNIKYIWVDGEKVPLETGDYTTGYDIPVVFYASISNKLSEALIKEFGVDNSTNFVQIVADKGELPLTVGDLVWKQSEVAYQAEMVDKTSCDYIVMGVADEGLTADLFLLQKNVSR